MLSNALRVDHKTGNNKKARPKAVEAQAPKQSPAPISLPGSERRPVNARHLVLGLSAVGVHAAALLPFVQFYTRAISSWLLSGRISYQSSGFIWFAPSTQAVDAGIMLSLLIAGGLFFKRQQRAPMLANALLWIVLLCALPNVSERASWPCLAAVIATLATAFALGRKSPDEPEAPIK